MPIYEEQGKLTRADLIELSKKMKCAECGGWLSVRYDFNIHKAYLACNDYLRTHHEGTAKYKKGGISK